MTTTPSHSARVGAVVVAALSFLTRAEADAPQRLATEGTGRIELTDEKVLTLVGLRGQAILTGGGERGEILFTSVRADDRKTELPVAVWVDATVLTLRPAEGQDNAPRLLEITLPPGFDVRVDTTDAAIVGSGLDASLSIAGARVAVDVRGVNGKVVIDGEGTKLRLESINGSVSIKARDTEISASGIAGLLSVRAVRGTLAVATARGFDGELDSVTAKVENVDDPVKIQGRNGTLVLTQASHGGAITLVGTTLRLERCAGDLAVTSDTAVKFKDCKAALRFDGDGAALTGERNAGSVDVRTRSAAVVLQNMTGPARIEGDALDVKLEHLVGELTINASTSQLAVTDVEGAVTIDCDGGGIALQRTLEAVKIVSRGGDVKIVEARGPVQVDADSGHVEIGWSSMSFEGVSGIRNASGGVVARFPSQGASRIEVKSKFGQIESRLPNVKVAPDGHDAQGLLAFPGQCTVTIEAGGDVQLLGSDEAPEPPPENDN
jgi:DUF4097 and DUF4098 domain-containing protein YvlB